MKTRIALTTYYLAIACLVIFAGIIAMKLIFWPPCTQMGRDCVVDGWSVAGLAGTVLAVAATVLAVLGAVAVAAWWTSLNGRVTDQVRKLYDTHRTEVNAQVDNLIKEQQKKVDDRLALLQKAFDHLDQRISGARSDIDSLQQLSRDVEEIAVDGLMVLGASSLEGWAKRAMANNRFPRVPVKMTESYLHQVSYYLPKSDDELSKWKDELDTYEEESKNHFQFQIINTLAPLGAVRLSAQPSGTTIRLFDTGHLDWVKRRIQGVVDPPSYADVNTVLRGWEGALDWIAIAQQTQQMLEPQDKETLEACTKGVEAYRPQIELLQQRYDKLRDRAQPLLAAVTEALKRASEQKPVLGTITVGQQPQQSR